jgi:hypothetical protein
MHLWQLDLVGGVPLADGRECKMVTGIDDHFRFVVIAAVVAVPSGRAVCSAFTAAMRRYGVPFEVLSDNGKQFTGRHIRPQLVDARVRRSDGADAGRTPASASVTGSGRTSGSGVSDRDHVEARLVVALHPVHQRRVAGMVQVPQTGEVQLDRPISRELLQGVQHLR